MATEIELKLEVEPRALERLRRHAVVRDHKQGRAVTRSLTSVYFDTPEHALHAAGASLRVRHIGARRIQAVKTRPADGAAKGASGHLHRGEWEHEIAGDAPDPAALREAGLGGLLDGKDAADTLRPVFATRFRRSAYLLSNGAWEIELTLDSGEVDTGSAQTPISEAELELKRGQPADLYTVARQLAADVPVRVALGSKADRGYRLATGATAKAVKAPPLILDDALSAAQAFQAIGAACLQHLLHNEPVLRERQGPEAVHQMRVALRRLRSAVSLFKPLVGGAEADAIIAELKWITNELGSARDLDVFIAEILAPVASASPEEDAMTALVAEFEARRAAAYARALEAVASPRFTHMILDVSAWLEAGAWLNPEDEMARARLDAPVRGLAAGILGKRHAKALKKGRHFARLDAEHRHRVRIGIKKLRYATEFFESLFGAKKAKAFRRALTAVQDSLGQLNDVAVAQGLLHQAAVEAGDADRAFAAGEVAGWHRARTQGPKAHSLDKATAAWKDFAKAKPFWK